MMREILKNITKKYRQPCDLGSHFGTSCLEFSKGGAFCWLVGQPCDRFWLPPGPPLERIGPPPGHPWSDVPNFFDEFRSNFAPDVNDFGTRFPYFVNTGHTQNFQKIKTIIQRTYSKSIHTHPCLLFMFDKTRASPKPQVFLSRVGGTTEGITINVFMYYVLY